jgi:hypothetical protein
MPTIKANTSVKITGVRQIEVDPINPHIIFKSYHQTVSGSAWKKIGTDILLIHKAGYDDIIIKYNRNHPYKKDMHYIVNALQSIIPNLKIMEI